jgi:uncharacterized protein YkwD
MRPRGAIPLRAKLLIVCLLAATLTSLAPTAAEASFSASTYRASLRSQINTYRVHHGRCRLKVNTNLQRAAIAHSGNMATHHMLSHSSSSGVTWLQRIRWYGYKGSWVGENLAVGLWTPRQTLRAWINSSPHRANLLNGHFRAIGIGVAKGVWSGHAAYYITADFGGP